MNTGCFQTSMLHRLSLLSKCIRIMGILSIIRSLFSCTCSFYTSSPCSFFENCVDTSCSELTVWLFFFGGEGEFSDQFSLRAIKTTVLLLVPRTSAAFSVCLGFLLFQAVNIRAVFFFFCAAPFYSWQKLTLKWLLSLVRLITLCTYVLLAFFVSYQCTTTEGQSRSSVVFFFPLFVD